MPIQGRRFATFMGIDWSGAAVPRPPGIAVAMVPAGDAAPMLATHPGGWSRQAVLDRLIAVATTHEDMLVGIDLSPALPFVDRDAYFPGEDWALPDARALWAFVDRACAADPHLATTSLPRLAAAHFRRQEGRDVLTGTAFEPPLGRLRVVERATRAARLGNAVSCFNLIGAAQVGRSSLTGMRMLHRLGGRVPVWPFDAIPATGPLIVEVYSAIAAVAAGLTPGRTKLRGAAALDAALTALGSMTHAPLRRYDDHATDAMLIAAWLRRAAGCGKFWHPPRLTPALALTEGWTFGVP